RRREARHSPDAARRIHLRIRRSGRAQARQHSRRRPALRAAARFRAVRPRPRTRSLRLPLRPAQHAAPHRPHPKNRQTAPQLGHVMQNRYVCDIGDFGKYGLLRALIRDDLRLGVVWYLNPNEEENSDGGLVTYLQDGKESEFRQCDPELYDALRGLLQREQRNIFSVQQSGILRMPTLFYDTPLTFSGVD